MPSDIFIGEQYVRQIMAKCYQQESAWRLRLRGGDACYTNLCAFVQSRGLDSSGALGEILKKQADS